MTTAPPLAPSAAHRSLCDWRYCATGLRECGNVECRECYTEAGVSIRYGAPPPRHYGWEPR